MAAIETPGPYEYDAFISYSAEDGEFAKKLQKTLENYRPPKGLNLPQRRLKVFRYETDMTGAEYYKSIEKHLQRLAKLIVVCSPKARKSVYVDDEIQRFAELSDPKNIIPLKVAGIPDNEATASQEEEKAFPKALSRILEMPIAIDYVGVSRRRQKLNKGAFEGPWYALLAGIFETPRDKIEERDKKRRRRKRCATAAVAATVVLTVSILIVIAFQRHREAELQERVALARDLAIQADSVLSQEPAQLPLSVLLAIESCRLFPTVEAERILRSAVGLLPSAIADIEHDEVRDVALSPDGRHVAATIMDYHRTGEPISVWDVNSGRELTQLSARTRRDRWVALSFSPDGPYLNAASPSAALSWEVTSDGKFSELSHVIYDATSSHIFSRPATLSPNGKYVAFMRYDTAEVRKMSSGRTIARMTHTKTA